jgi:hypothetical protein
VLLRGHPIRLLRIQGKPRRAAAFFHVFVRCLDGADGCALRPPARPRSSVSRAQELGLQPYVLLWLRYTAFLVLYPLGVSSELTMVWLAAPTIRAERPLSVSLPNPWNVGFDYHLACWAVVALYVPGARGQLAAACRLHACFAWAWSMCVARRQGCQHVCRRPA